MRNSTTGCETLLQQANLKTTNIKSKINQPTLREEGVQSSASCTPRTHAVQLIDLLIDLLRQQDEQSLRSNQYLVHKTKDCERDNGRNVHTVHRLDDFSQGTKHGFGREVRDCPRHLLVFHFRKPRHDDAKDHEDAAECKQWTQETSKLYRSIRVDLTQHKKPTQRDYHNADAVHRISRGRHGGVAWENRRSQACSENSCKACVRRAN
mmetsp:Transcript_33285/g.55819  ORF Transcript_33285/g.55819 Transcript_33285/m.55819 type:complete len:208 (-) Transcript_33285:362-985(-)